MARQIPEIVRAAAGLAATVLDEARKLPETLPGLPIRLIGLAMQQAMRIQQQYAGLVARGDEVFTGLRGENEPGLATFDDDDEPAPGSAPGLRDSAFDRAAGSGSGATYGLDAVLPDPAADAVPGVDAVGDEVESGRSSIEELADEAPATAEILDEIAIDELVDQAPTLEETAPSVAAGPDAEPTADVATVDVLTPEGDIATVDATVTDEGIAAPESAAGPAADSATATDEGGTPVAAATGVPTDDSTSDEDGPPVAAATGVRTDVDDPDESTTDLDSLPVAAATGPRTHLGVPDDATTDEDSAPVAAATGVRTDVDDPDESTTDLGSLPVAAATGPRTHLGVPADATTEGAAGGAVTGESAAGTDDAGSSEPSGSPAPNTAPVDGYDNFSIAQLRGRLRGYALSTVQELVAYEEATRAREPYLKMLHNRLEKLEEQAAESSPLAPRGA